MTNIDYTEDTSHYDECLNTLIRHKNHHRIRTIAMLILSIANGYFHIAMYSGIAIAGLYLGIFCILYMLALMALSFFAVSDKPVLVILTVVLYALGLWYAYSPVFGIPLLILYGLQLFECPKAVWVKQQSGYPYFSERFNDQQKIAFQDYDSTYEIDDTAGEMADVAGEKDVLFAEDVTMPGIPGDVCEDTIAAVPEQPDASMAALPPVKKAEPMIPEVAVLNAQAPAPAPKIQHAIPDFEAHVEMPVPLMEAAEKETKKPARSEEIPVPSRKQPGSVMQMNAPAAEYSEDTSHYEVCRNILRRHKQTYRLRTISLLVLCLLCMVASAVFQDIPGMIFPVILFAAGYFSVSEKPLSVGIMLVMCLFGLIDVAGIAVPLLIIYALQLTECRKAIWVTQQPGYPYFSERFNEQQRTAFQEYEADHPMGAVSGEMHFMTEQASAVNPERAEAPLPVQAVPEASPVTEFPSPVWNVPDPVLDTSIITSDFPEINGDIPDLPEIPDIPKI